MIETPRVRLRPWTEAHIEPFAAMHADAEVMRYLGGVLDAAGAAQKLEYYKAAQDRFGAGRWALERLDGQFLGYVGVMPSRSEVPLAPHFEMGWCLVKSAWGQGYAGEGARAAFEDVFARLLVPEVLAYSDPDNHRSQALMKRLGMTRDEARDFSASNESNSWRGRTWATPREDWV